MKVMTDNNNYEIRTYKWVPTVEVLESVSPQIRIGYEPLYSWPIQVCIRLPPLLCDLSRRSCGLMQIFQFEIGIHCR